MNTDSIETQGFCDGFYRAKAKPPALQRELYMCGYWDGCQVRADEDARFDLLCVQWECEDALLNADGRAEAREG
jgi:hypothetical protein